MRSGHLDPDLADRRHADEIVRAREEAGERRGKRDGAPRREAHCRADHHLLRDVYLVEPVGNALGELLAERRVLHVCVEGGHARIRFAELRDGRAVCLARRDLIAELVGRRRNGFRRNRRTRLRRWFLNLLCEVEARRRWHELFVELPECAIELVAFLERLAVPAVLALDERHALSFDCPRKDHRGLTLGAARLGVRVEDRVHVVAVDHDRVPAERAPAARVLLHIVLPHGRPALAERVDIGDPAQIVEPRRRAGVRRFPHRALGRLAVAEHHVGAVIGFDPARVERRADGRADTLAERSGRHVDERQARRRMSLEIRIDPPQLQQLGPVECARFSPRRIQHRRGVAFRQNESIAVGVVRIFRQESHLGEEKRGDEVRRRAARRRMSAARFGSRFDGIDPQPSGRVFQSRDERGTIGWHDRRFYRIRHSTSAIA